MSGRLGCWAPWLVMVALLSVGGCAASHAENPVGSMVAIALAPLFPPKPSQLAREAFDPGNPDKRRRAIALLSSAKWGGEEAYMRYYRIALTDPDDTVRAACIRALGRHGTVDDVSLVAPHLQDKNGFVRWEAATALQRIHNEVAVAPLMAAAAHDAGVDVRIAAVKALGQYARPDVFNALVGTLNDRNFGVAYSARRSLRVLTGEDFGLDSGTWLSWGKKNSTDLFAKHQPYVWQPYEKPCGWWDKAQFWREYDPVSPRKPTGMEEAAAAGDLTPSS